MGAQVSRDDFEWSTSEQIHSVRRKEMLSKYSNFNTQQYNF